MMKNAVRRLTSVAMLRHNINICSHILIIQMLLCSDVTLCLRLRLDIPSVVKIGSELWLHCDYDLENDSLYSVKWYKNNQEFYRYMIEPDSDRLEHKVYEQTGINVEVKKLKDMRVYILPQKKIEIIGTKQEYKIAEDGLNLTCVAAKSKPVQLLAWFINGVRVLVSDRRANLSQAYIDGPADGPASSSLGISLSSLSNSHHLSNGVLTLRCSSIMAQIYGVNFEELVIEEHGRYAGLQQTEGDYETLGPDLSPPQIHGHNNKYNIDDWVDLNCSSAAASPPPLLEWFINGREALNSQLITFSQTKEPDDNLVFSSTIYDNFADFDHHSRSSVLGLRFQITKEHYQTSDGKLRLRCSATHAKIISSDKAALVLSGGRQSSSLFASYASANGIALGRIVFSAFLYYLWLAWINSL